MRKLVILATEYSNTEESRRVFERINWRPIRDESTIPKTKRIVRKGKHTTPLIGLEWEEVEYGDE